MSAGQFKEADIDFGKIDAALAKLVPPKMTITDVLNLLRERLLEQQAKEVTVVQMCEVLNARWIDIGERRLRIFRIKVASGAETWIIRSSQRSVLSRSKTHRDSRTCGTTTVHLSRLHPNSLLRSKTETLATVRGERRQGILLSV